MQVNTRAGLTFASGLRSILRSDPDVVMIGEIRDYETAKTSVEAALTGHLVLARFQSTNSGEHSALYRRLCVRLTDDAPGLELTLV